MSIYQSGNYTEDRTVVDQYCQVPADVSTDALTGLLGRVFGNDINAIARYATPKDFNSLLEWVAGDMRWPVAALVMRFGLGWDHKEYQVREIADTLNRSVTAVEEVTQSKVGARSYLRLLRAAHQRIKGAPPEVWQHNQLRALGLRSVVWTRLAGSVDKILTVDALRQALHEDVVRDISGIGPKGQQEIRDAVAR